MNPEEMSGAELVEYAIRSDDAQADDRNKEFWRIAKLVAAKSGISRERAYELVAAKGAEVRAAIRSHRAANAASENSRGRA